MSQKEDLINKLHKDLDKKTKIWDNAISKAIDVKGKEYNKKRSDFIERLNRSKAEQQQLISNYHRNDLQYNQEINRIAAQITALENQMTTPLDTSNADPQRKAQQIDQITGETQKEIVVDRHIEKVKRLEQILTKTSSQEKKLVQMGGGLTNSVKATLDSKNRNITEAINRLESIRSEIENKLKELEKIDKNESEAIVKDEKDCGESVAKQRKHEMNQFITELKKSFQ